MKEKFKKIIKFKKGTDGSCYIIFVLKGKKGAIDFVIRTGWIVINNEIKQYHELCPWGIVYHSIKKINEDDTVNEKCEFLNNKKCYSSTISFVESERLLKLLITRGEEVTRGKEVIFEELKKIYCRVFKVGKI